MSGKAIQQKIAQLTELLGNPHRNEGSVLRVYYELFQLSHEGRDLSLDTVEWLNESASLFLSAPLVNVLTKLRLEVYGFKFAALNFIDIDDVIDDLLNGEILKSVHSLPPGAFNKLKSQLLDPPPPIRPQQQPQSQPTVNKTPHQQPLRRNYFAAPSSTSSSDSIRGNDSDESDEGVEEDPYSDEFVPQRGRLKGGGGFYKNRRDASVARSVVPRVNPPRFAPTSNRPQSYVYPPRYEPPFQPTQHPQFEAFPIAAGPSNHSSGMGPLLDEAPVSSLPGVLRRRASDVCGGSLAPHDFQIDLQDQTSPSSPSSLTVPAQQISTYGLLANIPEPQYSSVSPQTEGVGVLFNQHCELFRFDDGEWKDRGVGQLKLLCDPSTKQVQLLMRREKGLKVCAKHTITKDFKLLKMNENNCCVWSAIDYTDDENGKLEIFSACFETEKQCVDFREVFEAAQLTLEKAAQQWSCGSCYVKNKAEAAKCIACDTTKPGAVITVLSAQNGAPMPSTSSNTGMLFSLLPQLPSSPPFATAQDLHGTGTAFYAPSQVNNVHSEPASPLSEKVSQVETDEEVIYCQPATLSDSKDNSSLTNTLLMQQDSTASISSPVSDFNKSASFSIFGEEKSTNGERGGRESISPRFVPIIPLPALVDVKTGEEDEEIIFSHRAKLYRFDVSTREWKEKGVGDIKILHHRQKNTYRILMRRDQVHKLACNHWITLEMVLKSFPTSKKAWAWFAMDFAQNELLPEHFAVRFKLVDTAHLFYSKFAECQSNLKSVMPKRSTIVPSTNQSIPAAKDVDDEEQEEDQENDTDQSIKSTTGDGHDESDLYAAQSPASGTD